MKISDAGKFVAAIGVLAASLTGFDARAFAATGIINVKAEPEGARYLIVTSTRLVPLLEGATPYFSMAFPTGKYKVCFELDGYVTVWQDVDVSTFGSSRLYPRMERATGVTRATCVDDLTKMKLERGLIKASVLETVRQMEPGALQQGADAPPEAAPAQTIIVDHVVDHDHYDDVEKRRSDRAAEIRERREEPGRVRSK